MWMVANVATPQTWQKKSLGMQTSHQLFFLFGGVKFRQNEGHKIKERIFCHNIIILVEILSNLEIKKKPIRHIWTFDFSLVAFLKLGF
jgi:hypothetical protein